VLWYDLQHRRARADYLAGMTDNSGDNAGAGRADFYRAVCLAGRKLLIDLGDLCLQGIDLVARGDRDRCELVLGIVQFSVQPQPAALELLQLELRLHPALLTRIEFIQ